MYNFIYLYTEIIDEENKYVYFECERFKYHVRCFQNILQYVKGERPETFSEMPIPPTDEEILAHYERKGVFNADHTIVQNWLDSL